MEANLWMNLLVLERKRYHTLTEVFNVTKQLAEAVDRQDAVSIRILLSMRQEPILHLGELQAIWEDMQRGLPPKISQRAAALLQGSPTIATSEQPVADQVSSNQRLVEKLIALDSRVSRKLGGDKSFYGTVK